MLTISCFFVLGLLIFTARDGLAAPTDDPSSSPIFNLNDTANTALYARLAVPVTQALTDFLLSSNNTTDSDNNILAVQFHDDDNNKTSSACIYGSTISGCIDSQGGTPDDAPQQDDSTSPPPPPSTPAPLLDYHKCGIPRTYTTRDPFGLARQAQLLPASAQLQQQQRQRRSTIADDEPELSLSDIDKNNNNNNNNENNFSLGDFGVENLIVGGQATAPGQLCWQAGLQILRADGRHQLCGGSILSDRWILTAGHCVVDSSKGNTPTADNTAEPRSLFIVVGSLINMPPTATVNDFVETGGDAVTTVETSTAAAAADGGDAASAQQQCSTAAAQKRLRVRRVIVHPQWRLLKSPIFREIEGILNDVALLELDEPIDLQQMSPCVCTMCLARQQPHDGEIGIISGYGCQRPDCSDAMNITQPPRLLQYARMAFVPDDSVSCFGSSQGRLAQSYVCVGGKFGVDACPGDSGGPFVAYNRDLQVHYQVGVASIVMGNGQSICGIGNPARYTELAAQLSFIQQYVEDAQIVN